MNSGVADCRICTKHAGADRASGELIGRWEGFWVYHAPPDDQGVAVLGRVFIETDRHAPYLADLTDEEAAALGRLRVRLSRALRTLLDAEVVMHLVIGLGVAHFHELLIARPSGTPRDVPWHEADRVSPRATTADVANLARQLEESLRTN